MSWHTHNHDDCRWAQGCTNTRQSAPPGSVSSPSLTRRWTTTTTFLLSQSSHPTKSFGHLSFVAYKSYFHRVLNRSASEWATQRSASMWTWIRCVIWNVSRFKDDWRKPRWMVAELQTASSSQIFSFLSNMTRWRHLFTIKTKIQSLIPPDHFWLHKHWFGARSGS